MEAPIYKAIKPKSGQLQKMVVKPEVEKNLHVLIQEGIVHNYISNPQTAQVRPFGLAAVLRNIAFTEVFVDAQ